MFFATSTICGISLPKYFSAICCCFSAKLLNHEYMYHQLLTKFISRLQKGRCCLVRLSFSQLEECDGITGLPKLKRWQFCRSMDIIPAITRFACSHSSSQSPAVSPRDRFLIYLTYQGDIESVRQHVGRRSHDHLRYYRVEFRVAPFHIILDEIGMTENVLGDVMTQSQ